MASSKVVIRPYKGCINSDGTTIVFVLYSHKGKATYISTGETVHVDYFDEKRCEVKKSYRGYSTLNMILQSFKEKVDNITRTAKLSGIEPTCDYIKGQLRQKKEPKAKIPTLLEFITQYGEEQKVLKNIFTIRSYNNTLNHLKAYSAYIGKEISFNDIDLEFYDSFLSYLFKEKNHSNNQAGNQIKRLKLFMGVALERNYHNNLAFRSRRFKVLSETADTIYLNEDELEKMYRYDFSYDKRLENTRNLFIVGAFTGLRYSDLSTLNASNLQNGMIVVNTKKTDEKVCIPCHKWVQEIIDHNIKEFGEPFVKVFKGEQKFNVHIKSVARLVGLNKSVIIRTTKGGKVQQTIHKQSELISSHCCRRSFATNAYKRGIPSVIIMRITGHRTERNFLKYIKISQEAAADMLKEYWDKGYVQSPEQQEKPASPHSIG